MGSASIIVYIALAIFLLLLISQNKPSNPKPHHRHRRLKLRSNFTLEHKTNPHDKSIEHPIPFDPLVAKIEMNREDKQWEHHHHSEEIDNHTEAEPEWEDFIDAEDYLNDEHKFNVTERLLILFPKIDIAPGDGFVSLSELTQWNYDQSLFEVLHRTARQMQTHDKNKDGLVSLSEYDPPNWVKHLDKSSGKETGWWQEEHFNVSDIDGDGKLNITEFNDFLHPADTSNPKLLRWLCQEEIRGTDSNRDGKIEFKEFYHGPYDLIRNYDDEIHHTSHHNDMESDIPARKMFAELDKDGDGFLTDVELFPVIGKLHPTDHFYAKQQAEYAIQQADTDKDGRLTLNEMVANPYAFYNAIHNDDDQDEDDYEYHDEFR